MINTHCPTCGHAGTVVCETCRDNSNYRRLITQDAAYALLVALENEVNEMRLHYRHPAYSTIQAIANANGES